MTIQRQLFILISGLILVITAAQLFLLFYFKESIVAEIRERGNRVAEQILDFTVEEIGDDEEITAFFDSDHIEVRDPAKSKPNEPDTDSHDADKHAPDKPGHIRLSIIDKLRPEQFISLRLSKTLIQDNDELKSAIANVPLELQEQLVSLLNNFLTDDARQMMVHQNNFVITLNKRRPFAKQAFKRHLKHKIEVIRQLQKSAKEDKVFIVEPGTKAGFTHKANVIVEPGLRPPHTLVEGLFHYTILTLVATALLGLVAVFWLSRKLSSPLQQLTRGFKQLEQGEFGCQIQPSGVTEVRYTMGQFNAMSERLAQLNEAEKKLAKQQHMAEIGDVSKGIAHALRNPLHTIGLAIEQLNDSGISERVRKKLIGKVNGKIAQLNKSIQALLTVTNGDIERKSTVKLVPLVKDVILELRQSHRSESQSLNIDFSFDEDASVTGEDNELRSVIHTLLFNALEASDANSKAVDIKITLSSDADSISLSVQDQGQGLEPDIRAELFKPHVSSKAEGAGMGLYISKRIVELYYDGGLTVENRFENDSVCGVTAKMTLAKKIKTLQSDAN